MKLKVFSLRLDPTSGIFDDTDLQAWQLDKDVIDVTEHLLHVGGAPVWCLLLRYIDGRPGPRRPATEEVDPRTQVPLANQPLFDTLRRWRNERAKRDGRPAYVLLTNKQLIEVARLRPTTTEALRTIEGIGEARARELGEEILALVQAAAPAAALPS